MEKLVALSNAMGEADFLELDPTVLAIVKGRFSQPLKLKFADKSEKAEEKGEKVNVAFVITFLKGYFKSINRTFGMGTLTGDKTNPNPASLSSPTSAPSSPSSKSPKPGGTTKASIAAVNVAQGQRKPHPAQRQWSAPSQQQQQQQQLASSFCFYCNQAHALDTCSLFIQLSYEDKMDYLYKQ